MILNPLVLRLFYTRLKILNQAIQRFLGLQGLKDYQNSKNFLLGWLMFYPYQPPDKHYNASTPNKITKF